MKPSEWTWPSANSGVDADVVVVGGGMSGISAALAARRSGCRVLLAERHGFLGGAATAGSVAQFVGWATRAGRRVVRGIAGEIEGGRDGSDLGHGGASAEGAVQICLAAVLALPADGGKLSAID